jgi:hypothetical protein
MRCKRCAALGGRCPTHAAHDAATEKRRAEAAARPGRILCRHCGLYAANRHRGLCWTCYQDRAVRALYPSSNPDWYGGGRDVNGGYALPPGPTDALPGTPEKWRAFRERIRLCVALHHPDDARVSLV